MIWWNILSSLAAHLRNVTAFDGIVEVGMRQPVPDSKRIQIIREAGPVETDPYQDRGSTVISLYCWEQQADTDDPEAGYALIAAMEEQVINEVRSWSKAEGQTPGTYGFKLRIRPTEGDSDMFRPMIGCRVPLEIDWFNCNDE